METTILVCRVALWAYYLVLGMLCVYGAHRLFLVWMFYRVRMRGPSPVGRFGDLPAVTVQLPMFNERLVAERVIESACRLDYPREKLEIQVLDDSTDETQQIARSTVERFRNEGFRIAYLHRADRTGYKAGALEAGLAVATGEYVAVFDADFLPPPTFLKDTIHYFMEPQIGMVQARWEHLNRSDSLLTTTQAMLLDGHFMIEHTARNRSGRYMSFNGTAGIWRKQTICDAGGWQHDTLTEDLDLSYRAQLRGWKFVFLPQITAPAELPPEMNAFKAQQHRWTKGGAQTCAKLLPAVLGSAPDWRIKLEAIFHLTSCVAYVLMVLLTLLIGPALWAKMVLPSSPRGLWMTLFEMLLFVVGFGSATAFYIVGQIQLRRGWWNTLVHLPGLMAVGVGIAFNNALATLDGFFGSTGEFVRTPKFGDQQQKGGAPGGALAGLRGRKRWQMWAELLIGCYLILWMISFAFMDGWFSRVSAALPFMLMFTAGYLYVAWKTIEPHLQRSRPESATATVARP